MADMEKVLRYNREISEALRTLYEALPPGQQRTVLKNPEVKALLVRYHVIEIEEEEK